MIVGICGFIGSGKDTFADILIKEKGFVKLSFASSLKDAVSLIFGWDRNMLEGASHEARTRREQVDEWWSQRLNIPHLTPRWVLQHWGTDILRDKFHEDIWLASLERKIINSNYQNIVITDCRFPNEITLLKKLGAKMVQVNRTNLISPVSNHSSETSWQNTEFDFIVENDSSLDDLKEKVLSLFN